MRGGLPAGSFRHVSLVLFLYLSILSFVSCNNDRHTSHQESTDGYYTCPMHPSVVSDKPGACPVCNMNLVKKEVEQSANGTHENMLHLTPDQERMANIQRDTAKVGTIAEYTTLTGTVAADETGVTTIAARVSGRIEKLYVRNPGEQISEGQALYQLYSERLLADETDYIHTRKQLEKSEANSDMIRRMLEASRRKLLLWGLTEQQINELEQSDIPSPYITFRSNASGYLTALSIREGQYVEEGTPLFRVTDLGTVWIEAQVYAGEQTLLQNAPSIDVSLEQLPGKVFEGSVVFYNPQLTPGSKVNLVRIAIDNPGHELRPGMMAYVHLKRNEKRALVIPGSALLMEKMKTVWVQTEPGMYERRMVETGIENPQEVEILHGLDTGDVVITSGAYLLNSEYILKSGAAMKHNH